MDQMKVKGFTLFELLFASFLAILLASLAIPGFSHLHHRTQIDKHINALYSFIQTGRKESITRNKHIVLCGSSEGHECQSSWVHGFMLFIDENRNDQYDQEIDTLLQFYRAESDEVTIEWRSFRKDKPIRFIPAGITWHNNGTFVIRHNRYNKFNKRISLAKSGRAQVQKDQNG
jgi:type IV fimbrial biogenesis protein FimT